MHRGILYTAASGLVAGGLIGGQAFAQLPAQDFSYDYAEGGVVFTELDDADQDLVGPRLIGSLSLTDDIFLRGEASYLTDDIDITTLSLGPGYRLAVTPGIDLYGVAALVYRDTDPDSASSESETGYELTAGIRHGCMFLDGLQYAWEIRYLDVDTEEDLDDGIVNLAAKFTYALTPQWDAVGDLQINDAGDENDLGLALGARFNF
ncbi:hypothetical protein LRF89_04765 [Halorhodospira sp. 9621]|uniref:hypothetical protein n=1 Tax=Halorhodospira TaxID=85108 RepID=UPI001EE7CF08|nr:MULTISPECIES: hypothetical protein [Halorhodospira]MCG5527759.1 hypothetical protein [Halorhodospira halophila]MCG5532751.1 hypothetical protein [Halorhodospira sp. 9621]MCG5542371.1 hypothetical protein [Halorhodospira sp. 9628]